jgi:uncharacterized pyridoxamine 5'-phosphate oxidase family protein
MMTPNEIFEFLNNNPFFFLATSYENKPYVRGMMLHQTTRNEIIFTTTKVGDLYKHLKMNPSVELCFSDKKLQIRISGTAEEIRDKPELKIEIADARPFMKPWIEKAGYKPIAVFMLLNPFAVKWTRETSFEPKEYIQL